MARPIAAAHDGALEEDGDAASLGIPWDAVLGAFIGIAIGDVRGALTPSSEPSAPRANKATPDASVACTMSVGLGERLDGESRISSGAGETDGEGVGRGVDGCGDGAGDVGGGMALPGVFARKGTELDVEGHCSGALNAALSLSPGSIVGNVVGR